MKQEQESAIVNYQLSVVQFYDTNLNSWKSHKKWPGKEKGEQTTASQNSIHLSDIFAEKNLIDCFSSIKHQAVE